ncbi:hypothetical protein SAMN04487910_2442 [Aquimarina amphilecti]|uniref:Lipoprotein n=1 Tax=Aquimarina amphilecti TaxID=1038014 RepID=A0A1H7Q5K4_AQUAM|nr:hypothetical protein [Aquimarina amphilecti]SEL43350.1 hypothetical protein SAMN04487910_2442 [Aquimarina amphilecti]
MKTIRLLILSLTFFITSCSESITTTVAIQACQCIESNSNKDAKVCTNEVITANKEALENEYQDQGFPVLNKKNEVHPFYFQLIYMTMLQDECPELTTGK